MTADTHQPQDKYVLRFPEGMRDRLKSAASAAGRSLNAELVMRLEASFEAPCAIHPELARLIDQHIEQEVRKRLQSIAASIEGNPN